MAEQKLLMEGYPSRCKPARDVCDGQRGRFPGLVRQRCRASRRTDTHRHHSCRRFRDVHFGGGERGRAAGSAFTCAGPAAPCPCPSVHRPRALRALPAPPGGLGGPAGAPSGSVPPAGPGLVSPAVPAAAASLRSGRIGGGERGCGARTATGAGAPGDLSRCPGAVPGSLGAVTLSYRARDTDAPAVRSCRQGKAPIPTV